jgi:hypothetical protein
MWQILLSSITSLKIINQVLFVQKIKAGSGLRIAVLTSHNCILYIRHCNALIIYEPGELKLTSGYSFINIQS